MYYCHQILNKKLMKYNISAFVKNMLQLLYLYIYFCFPWNVSLLSPISNMLSIETISILKQLRALPDSVYL